MFTERPSDVRVYTMCNAMSRRNISFCRACATIGQPWQKFPSKNIPQHNHVTFVHTLFISLLFLSDLDSSIIWIRYFCSFIVFRPPINSMDVLTGTMLQAKLTDPKARELVKAVSQSTDWHWVIGLAPWFIRIKFKVWIKCIKFHPQTRIKMWFPDP